LVEQRLGHGGPEQQLQDDADSGDDFAGWWRDFGLADLW
jgi:hypothetical protein